MRNLGAPANIEPAAKPFVKWAGGKRGIIVKLQQRVSRMGGVGGVYYEPFLGGGALFYALANQLTRARLSDANAELMMAYQAIQEDVDKVIRRLAHHANRHSEEDYFYRIRAQSYDDIFGVAARLIYLNRTCYNGLYRVNQQGGFNAPKGRYVNPVICDRANLRRVAHALRKADLRCRSFARIRPGRGDFVYCDPPYDATYNGYTPLAFPAEKQEQLAACAARWARNGAKVLLSNSDTKLIRRLYAGKQWRVTRIAAPQAINSDGSKRQPRLELLISNVS